MKKQNTSGTSCCSTRQKIWGVIALAGLFACGLFVGISMNGGDKNRHVREIGMSESQCSQIASQITMVAQGFGCSGESCSATLRELNDIYTKNCAGRVFEIKEVAPAENQVTTDTVDKETCEVIEDMILKWNASESDTDPDAHRNNIKNYEKLTKYGCAENKETYQAMIQREQEILAALTGEVLKQGQTCQEIESLLLQQLPNHDMNDCNIRIERAKIYANLSERGCPENSQQYVNLAAKELEIARALRDDNFSRAETDDVVETYRRLQMKQAASEVLDKVQKLTDPAIDFIMQVQKVIEE